MQTLKPGLARHQLGRLLGVRRGVLRGVDVGMEDVTQLRGRPSWLRS